MSGVAGCFNSIITEGGLRCGVCPHVEVLISQLVALLQSLIMRLDEFMLF